MDLLAVAALALVPGLLTWYGVRTVRSARTAQALDEARRTAALALIPLLEHFKADPEGFLEAHRARWPLHFESPPLTEGERVLFALRVYRRQQTQRRSGTLVITSRRLFFDPISIKTNWSRTWPSISEREAGIDHVRMVTDRGDRMVFEIEATNPDEHPGLILAILDYAAELSEREIAALPVSG